jgi:hypothetical protein
MESLQEVLRQFTKPVTLGGGTTVGDGAPSLIDRKALQDALRYHGRRNEKYFVIGVAMAAVLFVALLVTAFLQLGKPNADALKLASPLFGTSAAVIVWRMFKVWREKSYTDCVLALVPNVDQETLKTIVEVLVRKL